MSLHLWPIVGRADLLRAFRPGESATREAPFRTLRAHGWVTAGRSITTRAGQRATGRLSVFSSLNVTAARLAREGRSQPAKTVANAAARVERSPAFVHLSRLLSGRTASEVAEILSGQQPGAELGEVLRSVARVAEAELGRQRRFADEGAILIGRVAEVLSDYLVLEGEGGRTAVPRKLARAAHRDGVGDCLALLSEQIDEQQLIVRALPALELTAAPMFSPFGRAAAIGALTRADEKLLSGTPAPLRVLVPVAIGR